MVNIYAVKTLNYRPDFDKECYVCGSSPTVTVVGHICPDTHLCGRHFFNDRSMVDWERWNDREEGTE